MTTSQQYTFASHLFNPVFWHIRNALHNDDLRFIFIYGGSSASKTHTLVQALSLELAQYGNSTIVLRKFGVDIDDSVYSDFKGIGSDLKLDGVFQYQKHLIKSDSNKIRFRGLDDSEKLKGLSQYKYLYYNELTQFDEADYDQGRKRLRGRPGQKIIADWNPISEEHWIKKNVLDKEEWIDQPLNVPDAPTRYTQLDETDSFVKINARGNMLLVKITYKDNYWVVGHPDKPNRGFLDKHTIDDFLHDQIYKPNYYRIYGLGNWGVIKTGSEFWKSFNETNNTASVKIEELPIHISVDSNVRPYVTITIWQVDIGGQKVVQVDELLCKTPYNNAPKAAEQMLKWLQRHNYKDTLFVYGDPSGKAENTIDEDCKSFFDKFMATLRQGGFVIQDRVQRSAVRVALSGAFINEMFEGKQKWGIVIGNNCKTSIDDYNSVQEDENGGMAKPKVKDPVSGKSYEPIGHISDCARYFITSVLKKEYEAYAGKNRGNTAILSMFR